MVGDPGKMSEGHLVLVKLGSKRIRATRRRERTQEGIGRVGFGVWKGERGAGVGVPRSEDARRSGGWGGRGDGQ